MQLRGGSGRQIGETTWTAVGWSIPQAPSRTSTSIIEGSGVKESIKEFSAEKLKRWFTELYRQRLLDQ